MNMIIFVVIACPEYLGSSWKGHFRTRGFTKYQIYGDYKAFIIKKTSNNIKNHSYESRRTGGVKGGFQISRIPVPLNWQMHGYGIPVYANIIYPFDISGLKAPGDFNPVVSYKREFTVPENWDNRKVYLHFAGVESAFYLWYPGT
ncbi:sugar-binding domain-containing protein [Sinomicrobium soli]|uniref:sugar-binding domain-containing protein n=1 Tax=Sinomicrobium sp. N-1-3-6 TaxID=2219864 RepID=UPI000DCD6C97|nr:sugar-binding domain-containing protein [Sinomicrobium sp. N-1-3-6]RAV28104.1 hypothetical protein DN748_15505 [Sinomicrobium sp. N-1-3-6]